MSRARALRAAAIAGPPAFLASMYALFATDVPYLDQWEFVPFLERFAAGTLAPADFWAQHNEHRIVFPRLIMLGLAWLTRWNVCAELAACAVLGAGFAALLCAQARRAAARDGIALHPAFAPLLSLLCFTLAQWHNWFLGWQLQLWLSALATLAALECLSPTPTRARFAAAAALGSVASFSFASGLLVWPLGALALALPLPQPRAARGPLAAWCAIGALHLAAYLWHYQTPAYHPAPGIALAQPWQIAAYVPAYLGQPAAGFHTAAAAAAGAVALAAACALARNAHRGQRCATARLLALWIAFAAACAVLTAAARGAHGAAQAMSPRYVTLALPLWAALLLGLAALPAPAAARRNLALALVAAAVLLSSLHGAYRWTERYHVYARARAALVAGGPDEDLHWLYPDLAALRARRAWLEAHAYSVFAAPR